MELDRYDRHILEVLQAEGRISNQELADRIGRPGQANTILRTLSGARVYKGLRPVY